MSEIWPTKPVSTVSEAHMIAAMIEISRATRQSELRGRASDHDDEEEDARRCGADGVGSGALGMRSDASLPLDGQPLAPEEQHDDDHEEREERRAAPAGGRPGT